MARKEKSNYTQDNNQLKRKQSKPGRPKKPAKEQLKQLQVKVADVRMEIQAYSADMNNSQSDGNTTLDHSKVGSPEISVNEISFDETHNSIVDYDGMPKLSPMTKNSSDNAQTKASGDSMSNSIGGHDEGSSSDMDKPFLKPAAGRSRRERGRPRGNHGARKIAKTDSFEGTNSD